MKKTVYLNTFIFTVSIWFAIIIKGNENDLDNKKAKNHSLNIFKSYYQNSEIKIENEYINSKYAFEKALNDTRKEFHKTIKSEKVLQILDDINIVNELLIHRALIISTDKCLLQILTYLKINDNFVLVGVRIISNDSKIFELINKKIKFDLEYPEVQFMKDNLQKMPSEKLTELFLDTSTKFKFNKNEIESYTANKKNLECSVIFIGGGSCLDSFGFSFYLVKRKEDYMVIFFSTIQKDGNFEVLSNFRMNKPDDLILAFNSLNK